MTNFDFQKWNKILGWFVFIVALITYMLTVEPTASFWDAGEYISTSAKLQVGHPPGAPLFQMMGAFFSTFASDADQIALMVNLVSGFSSAFTILFMFWSITILVRKIAGHEETLTTGSKIAVLGSGGREHAICYKLKQSKQVKNLYCIPGNAGTSEICENINIEFKDFKKLHEIVLNKQIELLIIGPEVPLVNGITDFFEKKKN